MITNLAILLLVVLQSTFIWFAIGGIDFQTRLLLAIFVIFSPIILLIRKKRRLSKGKPFKVVYIFCALLTASIVYKNWPCALVFTHYEQTFENLALQIRAGKTIKVPLNIGPYSFEGTSLHQNSIPCFWFSLDPSGNVGIVQTKSDNIPFNLWSSDSIIENWQFIIED